MSTLASLGASGEHNLALVAGSSHTLSRFLVNEILTTRLAWPSEDDLLLLPAVVGNDGSILLVRLDEGRSLLPADNLLGLGSLGGVAGALGAADVLAVGALFSGSEGSIAAMAGSAYTHADGLVHAENGIGCGRGSLPLGCLDL